MYFPYFRGRQYELLALKELASQKLISKSVIPVIEPIKQIPALKNALKAFNDAGLPIGIIVNPNVGGLIGKSDEICSVLTTYQSTAFPGILINSDAQLALERLSEINFNKESLLTVMDDQDKQQLYEAMGLKDARYTLCPFDRFVLLKCKVEKSEALQPRRLQIAFRRKNHRHSRSLSRNAGNRK